MNAIKGFLRLPQVLEIFPVGRSTWWLGVKQGKYPQPIKLSKRTTAWALEDIIALIESYQPSTEEKTPRMAK